MKTQINLLMVPFLVIGLLSVGSVTRAEVVTINSGVDTATFIHASWGGGGFDHVFTSSDFSAARTGTTASVVSTIGSPWAPNGSTSSLAKWICCASTPSPDVSALYAIPFTLSETAAVKLDFSYMVDDNLGDHVNSGLFINGNAVSGTNTNTVGEFYYVQSLSRDITPYVVQGVNYLYVYQYDGGGVSGAQFTAIVTATPEPCSIVLLGLGGLLLRRK